MMDWVDEGLIMSSTILVTGPASSGKSAWAETLAQRSRKAVVYIATARENPDDEEWQKRIQKHQKRRPLEWTTLLVQIELTDVLKNAPPESCLLIDSLGTWVANLLTQDESSWELILADLLATVESVAVDLVFVAEETGWGVVPAYPLGRSFRDRLGSLVRHLGGICDPVYLVTGGHVLNLSVLGQPLSQLCEF
jgi:adenosylcobinamide kinase/adenosylcobinamide-phosphate guanylyltransferase